MKNASATSTLKELPRLAPFESLQHLLLNFTSQLEAEKQECWGIPLTKYGLTKYHFNSPLRTGNFQHGHGAQYNSK